MSTDRNKVRSAVEVFIENKHCTLFLDWDITTETGKAKAIEFITDLWLDLEEQIGHQFPETTTGTAEVPRRVRVAPRSTPSEFMPTPVLDLSRPRGYARGPHQVPRNLAADL